MFGCIGENRSLWFDNNTANNTNINIVICLQVQTLTLSSHMKECHFYNIVKTAARSNENDLENSLLCCEATICSTSRQFG